MVKTHTVETVYEYENGKLIKKTVTETNDEDDRDYKTFNYSLTGGAKHEEPEEINCDNCPDKDRCSDVDVESGLYFKNLDAVLDFVDWFYSEL